MAGEPPQYTLSEALLRAPERKMSRHRGDQTGTVYLSGGSWHVRYRTWVNQLSGQLEWKQVSRKVGPATGKDRLTKTAAEEIAKRQYVDPANGLRSCPTALATLRQFVEIRFIPDHVKSLKSSGQTHYKQALENHILPSLGEMKLCEINAVVVQRLISAKRDTPRHRPAKGDPSQLVELPPYGAQTIKHIKNVLSAVFAHAIKLGMYVGTSPTANIVVARPKPRKRPVLTWEEISALAEQCGHYRLLVLTVAVTGLRKSEVAGLRCKRANLSAEPIRCEGETIPPYTLAIREQFAEGKWIDSLKTEEGERDVPIPVWLAEQLRPLLDAGQKTLFRGPKSNRPLWMQNLNDRILGPQGAKLGIPGLTWHCLRHSNATLADRIGLTVAERQKVLGHSSEEMTMRYTHPAAARVRDAFEGLRPEPVIQAERNSKVISITAKVRDKCSIEKPDAHSDSGNLFVFSGLSSNRGA